MRYFIHLAYNGTRFSGWQIQPNASTIQGALTEVLQQLLGEEINIVGAGRTDSGVHATNYFAHFETEKEISTIDFCYKLNRMLPPDIVIFNIQPVADNMHARFSATARTYTYTITQEKNPFAQETEYYYPFNLNIESMNEACKLLLGTQDFTSFSKLHTDVNNNICTITSAQWEQKDKKLLFTISANRFLRNMVRAIVGTMINVGRNKISLADFSAIIQSKNRQMAGMSIPACGLCLCDIQYTDQKNIQAVHIE